jgi:tRNA threonylcarbamoyladenosine modification (KEOPS) complex  Pcc1 subunit
MKIKCKVFIEYDDVEKANTVLKSIRVDDFSFVKSKIDGKILEANIESNSVSSLLHTLDDYLACVSVAEKILDKN